MKQTPPVYRAVAWVLSLTKPLGLYIHIPFCKQKCNYCDFYSVAVDSKTKRDYVTALQREIKQWGDKLGRPIDTVYFGGGTPSLLAEFLPEIMSAVKSSFKVLEDAEITMEMNPGDNAEEVLNFALKAGVNRLSIGAQSGDNEELNTLGRRHTAKETAQTVRIARDLGFNNISLDIMLALPASTHESLKKSLDFVTDQNPEHISAYILKIEENTPFHKICDTLNLPDEDTTADQYLQMCEYLENKGYEHYEISNFCKKGMTSRHNLKYWELEEYLGIGPAAHSFVDGKRFFYRRNLADFINGSSPLPDGIGGTEAERIMLSLRLNKGLKIEFNRKLKNKCDLLEKNGLLNLYENRIVLTDKGMLLSNSIITEILECVI